MQAHDPAIFHAEGWPTPPDTAITVINGSTLGQVLSLSFYLRPQNRCLARRVPGDLVESGQPTVDPVAWTRSERSENLMSTASPEETASVGDVGSRPRIQQRRERQRQEARRVILDATEALMIESNGSDFSIRSLGERSGYSAPTVYHYFGDKDGLIDVLLEERIARLAEELEQVASSGDARHDLRSMLLAYFDFSEQHPTFIRLMWTLSRKGESRMPPAMDRVRHCVEDGLERFGESGQIGAFDIDGAGKILWGLIYGLVSLHITQPDLSWDPSLAERALDAMFLGMTEMENESR